MGRKEFPTTDLGLATTLLYFKIKLIRTSREGSKVVFMFANDSRIQQLRIQYVNDGLEVAPRKFLNLLRELKGMLYND